VWDFFHRPGAAPAAGVEAAPPVGVEAGPSPGLEPAEAAPAQAQTVPALEVSEADIDAALAEEDEGESG